MSSALAWLALRVGYLWLGSVGALGLIIGCAVVRHHVARLRVVRWRA